ncbi:hypothetical protein JHL22_01750 [Advenella sp. WQ 585]|uniref:Poly-beta-1,6-N-acetyl-D-glucosamine biosynthesis protein PgaD n=1 Tax=Advenella mandrilli TaxID=2800330 RepID=A0ABS1E940_9BURK|nr:hypothetical protein [Advenella mandrilli]MBK1779934.1 hypothetical protein [Advenella mandrilli]
MKQKKTAAYKNDTAVLSKTLLKLAMPQLVLRSTIIVIFTLAWIFFAREIIDFGKKQDYAGLEAFSNQLVTYLNSINNYIWWGLVLLGSLILYVILSSWLSGSISRAGENCPPPQKINQLINNLSPEGKEVLGWAWSDRTEPIKFITLKETLHELRNGRVDKLTQIKEQKALLQHNSIPELALDEKNP